MFRKNNYVRTSEMIAWARLFKNGNMGAIHVCEDYLFDEETVEEIRAIFRELAEKWDSYMANDN